MGREQGALTPMSSRQQQSLAAKSFVLQRLDELGQGALWLTREFRPRRMGVPPLRELFAQAYGERGDAPDQLPDLATMTVCS